MIDIPPLPAPPAALVGWVPVPLLNAMLAEALLIMQRRHPGVFERLAGLSEKTLHIQPTDLPLAFTLALGEPPDRPWLRVAPHGEVKAAAVVRGSFATLLDLLQGRCDGDGLFFARALTVEGDMEVVVALRNAIDGEGIDLVQDLLAITGPFGPPLWRAACLVGAAAAGPVADLRALVGSALALLANGGPDLRRAPLAPGRRAAARRRIGYEAGS
jgi:predicted lipid carrier protein YhbT